MPTWKFKFDYMDSANFSDKFPFFIHKCPLPNASEEKRKGVGGEGRGIILTFAVRQAVGGNSARCMTEFINSYVVLFGLLSIYQPHFTEDWICGFECRSKI